MAKKGKTKRPAARSKRKPKNQTEARAWLLAIAEHIGETFRAYRAHKPPVPVADAGVESYAASRMQRDRWLSDMRCLSWFVGAVKACDPEKPGKSLGRLLGLERGPGHPGGRRKPGKSLDLAREISEQRETKSETRKTRQGNPARTGWKEVGRDRGMSDQAARKRAKRASLVRAEDDAKEFAARLKQRLEQKPLPIGKAKARNEALAKEIRAYNRRKR